MGASMRGQVALSLLLLVGSARTGLPATVCPVWVAVIVGACCLLPLTQTIVRFFTTANKCKEMTHPLNLTDMVTLYFFPFYS
jgi:hypothetical protein